MVSFLRPEQNLGVEEYRIIVAFLLEQLGGSAVMSGNDIGHASAERVMIYTQDDPFIVRLSINVEPVDPPARASIRPTMPGGYVGLPPSLRPAASPAVKPLSKDPKDYRPSFSLPLTTDEDGDLPF